MTLREEVGAKVRRFYEEVPFPGIPVDKISSFGELEVRAGVYARALDKRLPSDAAVIDVGCGTGQLLCLLGQREEDASSASISASTHFEKQRDWQ